MDYTQTTWTDEQTPLSAQNLNNLEAGVKDAAQNSKQRGTLGARPAASAAVKNWLWTDSITGQMSYCDGAAWWPVGGRRAVARAASLVAVNIANPTTDTYDNVTLAVGDRLFLPSPQTGAQRGLYVFQGVGVPMTRAPELSSSGQFVPGVTDVHVVFGNRYAGTTWTYSGFANPTIDTSTLSFRSSYWVEPWHLVGGAGEPPFTNGWTNFDANNQTAVGFRIDSNGRVWLKGLAAGGTMGGGTQGQGAIFTLPTGYIPGLNVHLPAISNLAFGGCRVNGSGQAAGVVGKVDPIAGSSAWFSLDGISFSTDE